jgi:uncharacterized protein YdiU (UPF0061 family)
LAKTEKEHDYGVNEETFGIYAPSDEEIVYRWKHWATQYRLRILNELSDEETKSVPLLHNEEISRCERMKRVNPKYSLRNWILNDLVSSVCERPEV